MTSSGIFLTNSEEEVIKEKERDLELLSIFIRISILLFLSSLLIISYIYFGAVSSIMYLILLIYLYFGLCSVIEKMSDDTEAVISCMTNSYIVTSERIEVDKKSLFLSVFGIYNFGFRDKIDIDEIESIEEVMSLQSNDILKIESDDNQIYIMTKESDTLQSEIVPYCI